MRVVFMGTPEFSVKVLEAVIKNYEVVGVVTKKDAYVGKKHILTASPVKIKALENRIKVLEIESMKKEYQKVTALKPDIIITCAYGLMLNQEILDYPKYGCVNVHASLLPKLRGGAPIHRAIINGEAMTGITIMYMTKKMDAGDILLQESIKIDDNDNVLTLHEKLSELGAKLIVQILPKIFSNSVTPVKQLDNLATYAYNISREDERICFNKKAKEIYNQVRGLYPWPIAYTTLNNIKIKILEVSVSTKINNNFAEGHIVIEDNKLYFCATDYLVEIKKLMVEGKNIVTAKEFLNGQAKKLLKEANAFI